MSEYKEKIEPVRIRRITGYLVGDAMKNFNDGKFDEMRDRVKHTGRVGFQSDKGLKK